MSTDKDGTQAWHRVTLLSGTKVNRPTHYICACGETEPVEVQSRPFIEGEPHSNMAHLVSMWDGGLSVLDEVIADHRKAAQADALAALLREAHEDCVDSMRDRIDAALASYASNPAEAGA